MSTEIWHEIEEAETDEEDMPTFEHAMLGNRLNFLLRRYIYGKNLGEALDSTVEYRFLQIPATSKSTRKPHRQPDVSFVSRERLPKYVRSYPEIAPDLVIEIVSPTDRTFDLETKVELYQQAGVKLIWLVYPYSRQVAVYRLASGLTPQNYNSNQTLDGEDVIPGFVLPVNEIFDYPPDPKQTELNAE